MEKSARKIMEKELPTTKRRNIMNMKPPRPLMRVARKMICNSISFLKGIAISNCPILSQPRLDVKN